MDILEKLSNAGIVPVVVIKDEKDAVPTAEALLAGGIDVMEVTLRTEAALSAIKRISNQCSNMLIGAGTVITLDQCKAAVEAGAQFIVSPGFNEKVVNWCIEHSISITPGCVTPTEIMQAMELGLKVLKYFPANIYGGLTAMKALSGPFGGIKFIPTGGVNEKNLSEYINVPFIHAVGGSWLCSKEDIEAGNFDKITDFCTEARKIVLGFEVAHVGVNTDGADASMDVCASLNKAFGFEIKEGSSSNFASDGIEVMKSQYLGKNGHIAIRTNNIFRAIEELKKRGFTVDDSTAKFKNQKLKAVYLKQEFGGFAVHLVEK